MQNTQRKLDHLVSVRGLAAWLVVFYHSILLLQVAMPQLPRPVIGLIAHGYLAVDFFFVLSGFIIFINYHANFFLNFRHNALTFYWNRFSRIYPVHAFMLSAYLLLALAFLYASASRTLPPGYTAEAFWQSLVLVHAWTGEPTWWNVPSWSISAEWFVYLLFPFIAIFFHRFIRHLAAHLLLALSIFIAVYSAYTFQGYESLGAATFKMALIRAFLEFSLGAIAGSLFIHHHAFLKKNRVATGLLALVLCIGVYYIDIPNYATVPFMCFLLVAFLSVDNSSVSKILSNKFLVYLGEISYSTYMVHYFVYDVFKAGWVQDPRQVDAAPLLASFMAVLALSMLMHKTLEIPAQQYLRTGLFKHFRTLVGSRS